MRKIIVLALLTFALTSPLEAGGSLGGYLACLPTAVTSSCKADCKAWLEPKGGQVVSADSNQELRGQKCDCVCMYNATFDILMERGR